ncbi:MAG: tetratricopeptide repeat protein [Treponema sp.]|nr:tetratricopeptide repeat protein [Treponema sp.]
MKKHHNGLKMKILFLLPLGLALSMPVWSEVQYGTRPVNTVQDVPALDFSKTDFIRSVQDALKTGGTSAALSLYDSLPDAYASDADLLVIKASLLISAVKLNDAKSVCNGIIAKDPSNEDALELLLYIARRQNDVKSEGKIVKQLLATDQYNVSANMALGQSSFANKNYKQARLYYQKALVREEKNEDALFGLGQADYYLGAKDSKMDNECETVFKKLLEVNPQNSLAYSYLGKLAAAGNKYKVASDYVQKAIELEPDNYNYQMDYGMFESYLGHYDNSISAWSKAIDLQPNYFLAYAYRGGLYDEQGQEDLAISDYKQLLRCNPEYYYAYESIGVLEIHRKNWTAARQAFMKCFEMDKTSNVSYPLMVTYCYYMEGDKINAKAFSDKVLRKMDRNSIEYAMLRVWHDESGEMPLPQKISAISENKKKGKMWFYLGLFYDMFGGGEFASENYSKLLSMNSPMIFEYRMAEWRIGQIQLNSEDKSLSRVSN